MEDVATVYHNLCNGILSLRFQVGLPDHLKLFQGHFVVLWLL